MSMPAPNPYQKPIDADGDASTTDDYGSGWLWFFFSADGRIGRGAYIVGMALSLVLYLIAMGTTDFFLGAVISPSSHKASVLLYAVPVLPFLWSWFVLHIKRLHDRGKSASWVCMAFVPYVGGLWLLFECTVLEGTRRENRFGSAPLTPW